MQNTAKNKPDLLTVNQAQEQLGLSRGQAYRLIHIENAPIIRVGKRIYFSRVKLERWLEGNEIG